MVPGKQDTCLLIKEHAIIKPFSTMSDQAVNIPSVPELLNQVSDFGYQVTQPDKKHTCVYLELDSNHHVIPALVQYALLVSAGLLIWEKQIAESERGWPDFSVIPYKSMRMTIKGLEKKPCKHYRGWIGEIITHFLIQHFVAQHRDLLGYMWEAIQPAKAEVTDGELDIVAAYAVNDKQLGHISGEVKTYEKLAAAKNSAYNDLEKALHWSHNRDAQIRSVLNALLRPKFGVGALEAAKIAMGDERSFLPSLLHSAASKYKNRLTFDDLPRRFDACTRPSQLIGIQVVIRDFGSSCDKVPFVPGFFENFLKQMRLQALTWKKPARNPQHV